MCLPSPLFWDFSHGSFNVDITRATVLMIVGESVRSLLFVIMLTHLVTGRFSQYFLRDSRLYNHDQQVLGCKPRDFPAALVLGAFLLLRRSIGMARRPAWIHSCTSGFDHGHDRQIGRRCSRLLPGRTLVGLVSILTFGVVAIHACDESNNDTGVFDGNTYLSINCADGGSRSNVSIYSGPTLPIAAAV